MAYGHLLLIEGGLVRCDDSVWSPFSDGVRKVIETTSECREIKSGRSLE